jgi:iron-sulfur cluster repair protein YtfE (RIC family)
MKPTEVRARVLEQHAALREALSGIEGVASAGLAGEARFGSELRARVNRLVEQVEAHLSMEEEVLLPVLREIDAWGPVRAERLIEEHEAQRAGLERLRALEQGDNQAEFTRAVLAMIWTLLGDMRQEEHDILKDELLRDDVIAIDTQVS